MARTTRTDQESIRQQPVPPLRPECGDWVSQLVRVAMVVGNEEVQITYCLKATAPGTGLLLNFGPRDGSSIKLRRAQFRATPVRAVTLTRSADFTDYADSGSRLKIKRIAGVSITPEHSA